MNVPKLRFSEFNDEWKMMNIGNVFENISIKNCADKEVLTIVQGTGTIPRRLSGRNIKFDENGLDNYKFVEKNQFIIHLRSFEGGFEIANEDGIVSPAYIILKPLTYLNPKLYSNYFRTYDFINKKIARAVTGIRDGRTISYNDLKREKIGIPSIKEQEKIGNMLTLLDKKIELQLKKIEDLKLYKISNLKNVFSICDIRIKLKEICIIEKGKQINSDELTNDGKYYMLNGGISPSGYLNEYNTDENTITISEGGNSCGYINYNNEKFWCGGHCYKIIKTKINNKYLYQLLKYNESKIMDLRVGSGLPNIQKKDLENYSVNIHQKEKQNEISNFLEKIDQKLQLEILKLSKLQELKKGLMQNMFV